MTKFTPEFIQSELALAEKATPGPWSQPYGEDEPAINAWDGRSLIYDEGGHTAHDAALIVALRNDALRIITRQEAEIERLRAELAALGPLLELTRANPMGTAMCKISGPQWVSVVVGYYSSTFTPEGLVLECVAEGAKGQVHVEPAKRMEIVGVENNP